MWDWWGRTPLYSAVDVNTLPHGGRPDRRPTDATTGIEIVEQLLAARRESERAAQAAAAAIASIGDDRGCDSMLDDRRDAAAARREDVRRRRDEALDRARRDARPAERRRRHAGHGGSRLRLGRVRHPRLRPRHSALSRRADVEQKSIAALKLLLDAGADVHARTDRTAVAAKAPARRRCSAPRSGAGTTSSTFLVEHGAKIDVDGRAKAERPSTRRWAAPAATSAARRSKCSRTRRSCSRSCAASRPTALCRRPAS